MEEAQASCLLQTDSLALRPRHRSKTKWLTGRLDCCVPGSQLGKRRLRRPSTQRRTTTLLPAVFAKARSGNDRGPGTGAGGGHRVAHRHHRPAGGLAFFARPLSVAGASCRTADSPYKVPTAFSVSKLTLLRWRTLQISQQPGSKMVTCPQGSTVSRLKRNTPSGHRRRTTRASTSHHAL